MKLLITGFLGFIGANFTEYIFSKYPDDKIVGYARLRVSVCRTFNE